MIAFPPGLWEHFAAQVPEGERSAFIQRLVAREVGYAGAPPGGEAPELKREEANAE